MEKEKTRGQLLKEELGFEPMHGAARKPDAVALANDFCEDYKLFLNEGKTEREFSALAASRLEAAGYKPYVAGMKLAAGDKVYLNNRGKAIVASTIGTEPVEQGVRIVASHIDSPRLDLKPNPLYEDADLALFKTHYYGGIRKYQWTAIPLAMHGVVIKKDGTKVEIRLGEKEGEPQFCISDLLPHLSATQNQRTLPEGIRGEELNIICGSLPFDDEAVSQKVKLYTLDMLHRYFGITEQDFQRAEIEFVPAFKAVDVGFDRSLIGAYGQDDRICAYPSLMAEIETKNPKYTTVTVLTDKEEIGSVGATGLQGDYMRNFIAHLAQGQGGDDKLAMANAKCLSADVNAAFDPTFPDAFDPRNSCYLNRGAVITKYTGSRGKSGSNDATAEYMGEVTRLLDENEVVWQTGELGRVDQGGGGTVAFIVANMDVDTVDVGAPILSMHSPFELSAKLDVYMLYRTFMAFLA